MFAPSAARPRTSASPGRSPTAVMSAARPARRPGMRRSIAAQARWQPHSAMVRAGGRLPGTTARSTHMSSSTVPVHAEIPPPKVEEVSPGIFAYVQLDGSWFLNNAGCIVGAESATVIDTVGTEARARAFHAAVRRVTPKPVNALVNTHSHGDHTHGNFMFAPAAAIIGSERCRREIIAAGTTAHALFPMVD